MGTLLKPEQTVELEESRLRCVVDRFIDGGGQGEVYRAITADGPIAIKWFHTDYFTKKDPRLRTRLKEMCRLDGPSESFIWPFDLATAPGVPGFGYAMVWLDARFRKLDRLLVDTPQPNFRTLATIGFNLANAFNELHTGRKTGGRCYRDISPGNIAADPLTGEIRIFDNDNVDINGTPGPMRGTAGYKAPEVVDGKSFPDAQTDLHSLALILFKLLMVNHALEGRREEVLMGDFERLYGSEAVFIFDPVDSSNRPIPGTHDAAPFWWEVFPEFLRQIFTHAFTHGLRDRFARVVETQWRSAMVRLRDSIFPCVCGAENFYDGARLRLLGHLGACWNCQRPLSVPPRMLVDGRLENIVTLAPWTELFPHHLAGRSYDFSKPLARVTTTPLQIENVSDQRWHAQVGGASLEVKPGGRLLLDQDMAIHFGHSQARVKLA